MNPVGIVLAGGQSRRMGGGDKALLPLGGRPLISHVITGLSCAQAISANGDPARFAAFGLPVLPDSIPGFAGPLAGILAGMDWAAEKGADHIVTVAADTPFFPRDLVSRLTDRAASGHAPVVLARVLTSRGLRHQPVFGLWNVGLRHGLRRALHDEGMPGTGKWAMAQGAASVDFADEDAFFNINTPRDLALARAWLQSRPIAAQT